MNKITKGTPHRIAGEKIKKVWTFPVYPVSWPFRPIQVGHTSGGEGYVISRDRPEFSVFEFVKSGMGVIKVGTKSHEASAGNVYFLPKGVPHEYKTKGSTPWEKLWFNVAGSGLPDLMRSYGLENTTIFQCPSVESIFHKALRINKSESVDYPHHLALHLHRIATILFNQKSEDPYRNLPPLALDLRRFLDSHWRENVTLTQMAQHINRSRTQTLRLFSSSFGLPPHRYLLERRMETAKNLLVNTALSVKEVAFETGFSEPYHFATLFSRYERIAPGRYRQARTINEERNKGRQN